MYQWKYIVLFSSNISLNILPSRFVHIVINGKISLFFMAKSYSIYIDTAVKSLQLSLVTSIVSNSL